MTTQQRLDNIIDSFYPFCSGGFDSAHGSDETIVSINAAKCALIYIEGMIKESRSDSYWSMIKNTLLAKKFNGVYPL